MKSGVQTSDEIIIHKMINGKKRHSELYNYHYQQANSVDSFDSALSKTLFDNKTRIFREFRVVKETDRYILSGRIDEIRIESNRIVIVDDNDIDSLDPHLEQVYQHQVLIYSQLLFDQFFPFLDIIFEIRKAGSDKIFLSRNFSQFSDIGFDHVIDSIIEYWEGERVLKKTDDKEKCSNCRFRSICSSD
jgi:hypothetical protein